MCSAHNYYFTMCNINIIVIPQLIKFKMDVVIVISVCAAGSRLWAEGDEENPVRRK